MLTHFSDGDVPGAIVSRPSAFVQKSARQPGLRRRDQPEIFITARAATWGYNRMNTAYAGPSGQVENRRQEIQTTNYAGGFAPFRYDRRRKEGEMTGSQAPMLTVDGKAERDYLDHSPEAITTCTCFSSTPTISKN